MVSLNNKPAITPRFEINYPNKNRLYTSQMNAIVGTAFLNFSQEARNIISIDLGFKGDIRSRSLERIKLYKDWNTVIHGRVDVLFQDSRNCFANQSLVSPVTSFPANYVFELPFNFEFPTSQYDLPSSCNSIGATAEESRDTLTVRYEIYVRIKYMIKNGYEYLDFLVPLDFQGGLFTPDDYSYDRTPSVIQQSLIAEFMFMNKRKQLLPDDERGGMIPAKPPRHSKLKRLFSMSSKRNLHELQGTATSNVTLAMVAEVPTLLNINSSISDIPIAFFSSSKFNPDDLSYNGMSTKLGYFEINSIEVSVNQHLDLNGKTYDISETIYNEIFGYKPKLDIKNFQRDIGNGRYSWKTTLGCFITDPRPIFDLIKKPIMPSVSIGGYFKCNNTLQVSLVISTADIADKARTKKFELLSITKLQCNFQKYQLNLMSKVNNSGLAFYYKRNFSKTKPNKGTGGGINTDKKGYLGSAIGGSCITSMLYGGDVDDVTMLSDDSRYGYYQPGCYDCGDGYFTGLGGPGEFAGGIQGDWSYFGFGPDGGLGSPVSNGGHGGGRSSPTSPNNHDPSEASIGASRRTSSEFDRSGGLSTSSTLGAIVV